MDIHECGVSLAYLCQLSEDLEAGKLELATELYRVVHEFRVNEPGSESFRVHRNETIEVVKRAGFWRKSMKGRLLQKPDSLFTVPKRMVSPKKASDWTILDVVEYVVKPKAEGGAFAYTIDRDLVHYTPYEGYYVSVPPSSKLKSVVDALKEYFHEEDPREIFLWTEFLNLGPELQFNHNDFTTSLLKKRKKLEKELTTFVPRWTGHLVFFNNWGKSNHRYRIDALYDVRTLWDIYCVRAAGKDTAVIMETDVYSTFLDSLRNNGHDWMMDQLDRVLLNEDPERLVDLESLLSHVSGGDDTVIEMIEKQLKIWFARAYMDEAERMIEEEEDFSKSNFTFNLNQIAVIFQKNGEGDLAATIFQKVIDLLQGETNGEYHPAIAYAKNNLALLLESQQDIEGGIQHLQDAIEIMEKGGRAEKKKLSILFGNLANLQEKFGNLVDAEYTRNKLVENRRIYYGKYHPDVANALTGLGVLQTKMDKIPEAKENLLSALAILEKNYDVSKDKEMFEETIDHLAKVYGLECNHNPAEEGHDHHVEIAKCLYHLAQAYNVHIDDTKANHGRKYGHRALSIMKETLGHEHPQTKKYERELLCCHSET